MRHAEKWGRGLPPALVPFDRLRTRRGLIGGGRLFVFGCYWWAVPTLHGRAPRFWAVMICAHSWVIRLPPEGQAHGRGLLGFVPFVGYPLLPIGTCLRLGFALFVGYPLPHGRGLLGRALVLYFFRKASAMIRPATITTPIMARMPKLIPMVCSIPYTSDDWGLSCFS